MAKHRLAYLEVLCAGALFFIFFNGYLSFFVLLFLAALPVVSLLWLLLSFRQVRIVLSASAPAAEKREPFSFRIQAQGGRLLPAPCLRLVISLENSLGGEAVRETLYFPFCGRQTAEQPCRSGWCGKITCRAVKASALDFLQLFSLPVRLPAPSAVFVLPSREPAPAGISENSMLPGFGDLIVPTLPGSDFSEPFEVREYREGDPLHRIHWKLTQKTGRIMVREGNRPAGRAIRFLLEYGPAPRETDCVLEAFARLAFLLLEHGIGAQVFWTAGEELCAGDFGQEEEAGELLALLLSARPAAGFTSLESYLAEEMPRCAHLVYITPSLSGEALARLTEEEQRVTVLLCGAGERGAQGGAVVRVLPGEMNAGLAEVEL